jgi:signal transduction histidine kinase
MRNRWLLGILLLLCSIFGPVVAQWEPGLRDPPQPEEGRSYYVQESVQIPVWDVKILARYDMDSAIRVLHEMIKETAGKGDYFTLYEAYIALGATWFHKNDYAKSDTAYRFALAYSIKTQAPLANACRALNGAGNVFLIQGDYTQAARYYFTAAAMAEQQADKDTIVADQLVRIYNNVALSLIQLQEYDKALYYLNKSELLTNKLQHWIRLPDIWNNMAIVYNKTEEADKALHYSQRALYGARIFQHYHAEYSALLELAVIMLDQKQPSKAISYLQEALQIKGNINSSFVGRTSYLLGNAYYALNNPIQAERYFLAAIAKAEESRAPVLALNTHKQLAFLYAQNQHYHAAFNHLMASYRLNDSLLNKEKAAAVHQFEIKYRTAQKDREIAEKKLQLNRQQRQLQQKNIWIGGIAAGASILGLMLFGLARNYRNKTRLQAKQQEIDNLRAMIEGEERERARIARELHEGIAGMLTAVKMNFTAVRNEHPVLTHTGTFTNAMQLLEETAREIRQTAHNLTPEILMQHELQDAIALYCRQVQHSSGIEISFQTYGSLDGLNDHFRLSLYRMVQELISNAVKHAQARHLIVQISRHGSTFGLTVEDNGIGINTSNLHNGIGLQHLQSRVRSLNGTLTMDSSPGNGTTIYIEFHLPDPLRTNPSNTLP